MTQTLILSPDADIYHSLPLPHGRGNIMIQIMLSVHLSIELKYLHLLAFVIVLQNDPTYQVLFIGIPSTISYASEHGKGELKHIQGEW